MFFEFREKRNEEYNHFNSINEMLNFVYNFPPTVNHRTRTHTNTRTQ